MTSQPAIIAIPAFTVVGLLLHTQAMSPEIPAPWDRFVPRIDKLQDQSEPHVSYSLMSTSGQADGGLDYMAGNAVARANPLPPRMTRWEEPANTDAVLETTLPRIGEAFDSIYSTWLPSSGYQSVDGAFFERYGEAFSPRNPVIEFYIPVKKL